MPQYTRNPIEVEARQFFRYNGPDLANWCQGTFLYRASDYNEPLVYLEVPGIGTVNEEHWLIKSPEGPFYSLSDVEFAEKYSPVYPSPTEDDTDEHRDAD